MSDYVWYWVDAWTEHTLKEAESPDQYSKCQGDPPWWPLVHFEVVGGVTPPMRPSAPDPARMRQRPMISREVPEDPPATLPDGRPYPYWDPAGHYYWPYIPDEYERMIYTEVETRFLDETMRTPEPKPVWPEGERPLAPHWYSGG